MPGFGMPPELLRCPRRDIGLRSRRCTPAAAACATHAVRRRTCNSLTFRIPAFLPLAVAPLAALALPRVAPGLSRPKRCDMTDASSNFRAERVRDCARRAGNPRPLSRGRTRQNAPASFLAGACSRSGLGHVWVNERASACHKAGLPGKNIGRADAPRV